MRPGEIYYADLGIGGPRPYVVVSREELSRGSSILAVPVTSAGYEKRRLLSNCVPFTAGEFGFAMDCVAQCELLTQLAVYAMDLESGPIGTLDDMAFRDVIRAVGFVIASDCEPV